MYSNLTRVLLFILIPAVMSQRATTAPSVSTFQGRINGKAYSTASGRTVNAYLGIPYAQPPTGELRLQPPRQLLYNQSATLQATDFKPACPQRTRALNLINLNDDFNGGTSEDCLTLNVYVPAESSGSNLPVMVWIHGGLFILGTGSQYDGRSLAENGVIVVTINYRIGILGFFLNLGLQDQIMALQWVQTMISSFGGNPNEVTVFGSDVGGASVSLLSVSPKAKGLFKRVISQSGVATTRWIVLTDRLKEEKMDMIKQFVRDSGCTLAIVDCLKQANVSTLVELTNHLEITPQHVDNDVIMDDYATNSGLVHAGLEFIMGTVPNDGSMAIHVDCTERYTKPCDVYAGVDMAKLKSRNILKKDLDNDQSESVMKHYNSWYPMNVKEGNLNMMAATKLNTDRAYKIPTNKTASRLSRAGFKVRVYEFNAPSSGPLERLPWSDDAQHYDELPYLFGQITDPNKAVSDRMIKLWTDFAKGQLSETDWPLFTTTQPQYLYISDDHPQGRMQMPYFPKYKNDFWSQYDKYRVFPPYVDDQTASAAGFVQPGLVSGIIMSIVVRSLLNIE